MPRTTVPGIAVQRALWICRCAWTTLPRRPQLHRANIDSIDLGLGRGAVARTETSETTLEVWGTFSGEASVFSSCLSRSREPVILRTARFLCSHTRGSCFGAGRRAFVRSAQQSPRARRRWLWAAPCPRPFHSPRTKISNLVCSRGQSVANSFAAAAGTAGHLD